MCTAIYDNRGGACLGRTLDVECEYMQSVLTVPEGTRQITTHKGKIKYRFAVVGAGINMGGTPLLFDGVNSAGLAGCALSFPLAEYSDKPRGVLSLSSFEVLSYALARFSSIGDIVTAFSELTVTSTSPDGLAPTPLHWIFADKTSAVVLEYSNGKARIYQNPFGVMSNAPGFAYHKYNAERIMGLSPRQPRDNLLSGDIKPCSRGIGAVGLPGDFSSPSRFLRALFCLKNSDVGEWNISRTFHTLGAVSVPRGAVEADGGKTHTSYTSVMDIESGAYYFTTYTNPAISAVRLKNDAECKQMCAYSMQTPQNINLLN